MRSERESKGEGDTITCVVLRGGLGLLASCGLVLGLVLGLATGLVLATGGTCAPSASDESSTYALETASSRAASSRVASSS